MPEQEPETLRLAREAKAGDADSFGALYEKIAPALFTWAEIRIRREFRQHVSPEDVVQEVWCRAWKIFEKFDPDNGSFRYWIFRVAKNVLYEALRTLKDPSSMPGGGGNTRVLVLDGVPDDATRITMRVARDESLGKCADWIRDLDDEDRKLVIHCGLEGLTYIETAERLAIGPEAVAKRWQRLRERLRDQALPQQLFSELTVS
jgi:RNA polymerase sigma-70 factor (ECF subfamily)